MSTIFFLAFRESFEAWVIAGIIITYLKSTKRFNLLPAAYAGVIFGVIFSLITGVIIFVQARELSGKDQEIFEGIISFLAAALVAYFIIWISRHKELSTHVKNKVENLVGIPGIFFLSFISVLREGVELAVFILTKINNNPQTVFLISVAGLATSLALVLVIFYAANHFLLKRIFKFLGALLIYFGAEIFAEGLMKFLPMIGEMWEIVLFLIFALPASYIFFKDDIEKIQPKIFNRK